MIDALERRIFQRLYNHYPDWKWTPLLVSLGNWISTIQEKYHLDLHLLSVKIPTILDRLRAGYAYARYEVLFDHELVVISNANFFFVNCYFRDYKDALSFCRAVCFLRFVVALARKSVHDCIRLCFVRIEGQLPDYEVERMSLMIVYEIEYDEGLLPSDEVVMADEMGSKI